MRRLRRVAVVVATAAVLLLAPARPASAHATLSGSDPANGASLSRVPAVAVLRFTENLVGAASEAQLVDGAGRPVAGARLAAGSSAELRVRLPRLVAGSYALAWRVSGTSDGHPTEGVLVFTVERSAVQATSTAAQGPPAGGPFDTVLRWLRMVLLAGLLGGLAMAGPVLAPAAIGDRDRLLATMARGLRRRALAIAAACAGGAAVVGLVDLAARGPGTLRLAQVAVFVALVPVLLALLRRGTRPAAVGYPLPALWWVAAAFGGAACVIEAAGAAHAADRPIVALAMASAHVLTGCAVLGLLGIPAAVLWSRGATGARHAALVRSLRRPLLRLAVVGAALAIATGLYGAGRELRSVDQLVHTERGRLLLVQAGLVLGGGWLAISGMARLVGRRGTVTPRSPSRRVLAAGLACGLALLACGVVAEPAGGDATTGTVAASPVIRDGRLDDLVVSVSVVPNRPGPNGFTVQVASSRRPAPAPIERVALTYRGTAGTIELPLSALGSGRFFGTGTLGPAGAVQLVTVVRRSGADVSVPVEWPAVSGPALSGPAAAVGAAGLALLLDTSGWVVFGLATVLGAWWLVLSRRRWRVEI